MKPIKKILYPTDFSERSKLGYRYCLQLARQLNASIHVLHVHRLELGVPVTDAIAYRMIEERKKNTYFQLGSFAHLQKSGQHKLTEGLEIHAHVATGVAEEEIVEFSDKNKIDLIVMPTKGEQNLLETMFGSVTTYVASQTTCPILVLPQKALYRPIKEVAYATDFSKENMERGQVAVSVADFFGALLHLVHVYQNIPAKTAAVAQLLERLPSTTPLKFHELQGDTVQEGVQTFLKNNKIDLLMAYSPPKNFFERLFRMSTTRHLLHQLTCPLMIMR